VRGEITGPGKYETAGKSQSIFHSDQSHDLPPHPERGLLGCEQRTCTVDCCGPRRCPITNTPCPPLSRTAPPSISSVPVVEWLCSAQSHSDPMHWHTATQGTGTQAHSDPMHWHTATQCTGTQRPNALAHSDPMHWHTVTQCTGSPAPPSISSVPPLVTRTPQPAKRCTTEHQSSPRPPACRGVCQAPLIGVTRTGMT
jgi:hypothetical protein